MEKYSMEGTPKIPLILVSPFRRWLHWAWSTINRRSSLVACLTVVWQTQTTYKGCAGYLFLIVGKQPHITPVTGLIYICGKIPHLWLWRHMCHNLTSLGAPLWSSYKVGRWESCYLLYSWEFLRQGATCESEIWDMLVCMPLLMCWKPWSVLSIDKAVHYLTQVRWECCSEWFSVYCAGISILMWV